MAFVRNVDYFACMGKMVPVLGDWRECGHSQFDSEVTVSANQVEFKCVCLDCGEVLRGTDAKRLMGIGDESNND